MISVEMIITAMAVLSSTFTVYFSFRKVGAGMQKDTEWRTHISKDLKIVMEDIKEIKASNKESAGDVKFLIESQIKLTGRMDSLEKDMLAVWRGIDELKGA